MFTTKQLNEIRTVLGQFLVDECRISRPTHQRNFDEDTGVSAYGGETVIYTGVCRFKPTSGPRETTVGERVVTMRDTDLLLPHDAPDVERDDLVEATSTEDGLLDGRQFKVTDVRVASQQAFRRLSMLQIQPSRTQQQV